ncbi:MAG: Holliday junction resolvase RuvX [Anaerolineae bacterium]
MSRALALDWGEKRIGVAFSEGILAAPHSVIRRTSNANDYARIARLVAQTGAEVLVIGLPVSFNPQQPIGPQARRILKHSRALAKAVNVPVKLVDETYSTADADQFLRQTGKKGKIPLDAAAAAVILQTFLDKPEP